MPTIRIELFQGRSAEQKSKLIKGLTAETTRILGCSPESVDIILHEVPRDHWATGGILWSERKD